MYLGCSGAGALRDDGRYFCGAYFLYFWLMPFYSRIDPVKPVPERVTFHG